MFLLYKNKFKVSSIKELNEFISFVLELGENYISFLINRNRIYLPVHIDSKDAAVDLLAELFVLKKDVLIKFDDFFINNFNDRKFCSNEEFEPYLRGFVYTVIQNNIQSIYKENDKLAYNLYRNVKEVLKNLDYCITTHFSDKYVSKTNVHKNVENIPEKESLMKLVNLAGIGKYVFEVKKFIIEFFDLLEKQNEYANVVRLSDLISVMKSLITVEYLNQNGAVTEGEHITERVNVKYILEDVKLAFSGKLNKYISKNNLSQKFGDCMYNIIEEVMSEYNSGNQRRSVLDLMKEHFKDDDKYLFYKVQYCLEMFEQEIARFIEEDTK